MMASVVQGVWWRCEVDPRVALWLTSFRRSGDPISHRIYLPVALLPCSRRSQLRSIGPHVGMGALELAGATSLKLDENFLSAGAGELCRAMKEGQAAR